MPVPLRASLERLPALRPAVLPAVPAGEPGWTTCAQLHESAALDALIARVHTGVCSLVPADERHRVPPAVAPSYLFGWYVWAVACAATAPFVHARRVPRLHAESLAVRLADGGWPEAVAVLDPGFDCLPDDPEAGHPDAHPVRSTAGSDPLDALRAVLRARVDDHVERFAARWGRRGGRGRHALRALATDALVAAVLTASPDQLGRREAEALLPGGPVPPRPRVSCCLAYAVPGAEICTGCPRSLLAGPTPRLDAWWLGKANLPLKRIR